MHDLRDGEGHLIVGYSHQDGVDFSQSGSWEYLLCDHHEQRLSIADTYGVDFCRRSRSLHDLRGELFEVPNPAPNLLLRFALSIVWRHAHSKTGRAIGLSLGAHERRVRDAVFDHSDVGYQLVLTSSHHSIKGEPVDITSLPARGRIGGLNTWRFTLAQINFSLAITNEQWPPPLSNLLASTRDPAIVFTGPLIETADHPAHQGILARMKRPRPPNTRR